MDKKDKVETENVEATVENKEAQFMYGIAPALLINMVKEKRVYRFEMPIGAHLVECEEACNECLKLVKTMKDEAFAKTAEEEAQKEAEKSDVAE